MDSGVKVCSISDSSRTTARKEVAFREEVGSGSGGEAQERAGAEEGVVVLSPKKRRQEKRDKAAT